MTKTTNLKEELSNWLDEDVIVYIGRRHKHDGWTYRDIARDLSTSGYNVAGVTVANWMAYARKTGAL